MCLQQQAKEVRSNAHDRIAVLKAESANTLAQAQSEAQALRQQAKEAESASVVAIRHAPTMHRSPSVFDLVGTHHCSCVIVSLSYCACDMLHLTVPVDSSIDI